MAPIKQKLVKLLIIVFSCLKVVKCDCGIPSTAEGVVYLSVQEQLKASYPESTKLCGYCKNETHLLVSSVAAQSFSSVDGKKCIEIVCKHGSWEGNSPRCAVPLSSVDNRDSNGESMFTEISYYKGFVNLTDLPEKFGETTFEDGVSVKEPHCVYPSATGQHEFNHTWIFNLKHSSTVAYISLSLTTAGRLTELSTHDIASAAINDIRVCKVHHTEEEKASTLNFGLMCELDDPDNYDSNEDTVDKVLLDLSLKKGLTVKSACLWDFPKSCGTNEIPLDNRGFATPRCLADGVWDTLIPEPLIACNLPTNETYLHGNMFAMEDGGVLQYVNAKYYNQSLFAVPYTVEIHSCDDRVVGTRMCTEQGEWDSEEFTCSGSATLTLPSALILIAINILIKLHTN